MSKAGEMTGKNGLVFIMFILCELIFLLNLFDSALGCKAGQASKILADRTPAKAWRVWMSCTMLSS